ncbi:MAG: FG-GAP-like repeat-containing protein, partial [Flavobacterium sp.]
MKIRLSIIVLFVTTSFFGQKYHDTQGKLEISSSGQATYTLPIALPPSISSVGPTINITYASGQNSGIAGQGWNISGISYISRIATRLDIDGFKDGVDFDENDKLALEGQRLLIKTGNYWEDGSIYETEVQSNTKIELKGSGKDLYFIVTSPDGSRSWYGNFGGMHAVDLSAYYIVRYEDAEGNFILYNYSQPLDKSLCIDTIQFSANTNSNTSPLNTIKFSYTNAARSEKGYFKGVQIEKAELLYNIKVFTNDALFKEYRIGHETDPQLGYQRVTQIREFNGEGESANPVVFEYTTTPDTVNEVTTLTNDSYSINDGAQLTGDFDGDGKMDIVENNILHTNLFTGVSNTTSIPFNTTARQKFTATTLTNNKLTQKQSIVFADETLTNIAFKIHKLNDSATGIILDYTKNIPFDNSYGYHDGCPADSLQPQPLVAPKIKQSTEYLEGDFNGDGLSEVLIFSHFEQDFYGLEAPTTPTNKPYDPHPCLDQHILSPNYNEVRLIDLNPNVSNAENTAGNCSVVNPNIYMSGTKKFVMDFNSDGKADILVLNDSYYKIVSFKQLSAAPWVELEIIGQGNFDSYAADKPMLFGDYNGDGKPDIMIPNGDGRDSGNPVWNIYFSNPRPSGGIYFDKQSYVITDYVKRTGDDFHNYYAVDVNKDGKTDLVESLVGVYLVGGFWDPTNSSSRWSISTFINNIGNNAAGASSFIYNYHSPDNHVSDDNSYPIPLVADIKYRGLSSDMLIFRDHGGGSFPRTITYIDFTRNLSTENLIKKVTQSNGAMVDEITYASMQSSTANNGYGLSSDFYSSSNTLNYPFVELKQIPNNKLVQQLKNTTSGNVKYQDFKYNGYAIQLNGIGSIGFVKTARSAWYTAPEDKKIWSVSETDPLLRGAILRTYTTQPSSDDFSFSSDLSTGLMNKTENNFPTPNLTIFPYTLLLHKQVATDYVTGIVTETIYEGYTSDYNLPINVITNNYIGSTLQGSTTVTKEYDTPSFGLGSDYYIGRPHKTTTIAKAYGDTKTSSETFSYLNGTISEIDKNVYLPDGVTLDPVTMVEKMNYYPNGLLKDKEVSATGTTVGVNDVTPRKISYEYDSTNRFVKKVTDAEGLISTNDSFDLLYGTVLQATNPFAQTTISVYDTWGKRTSVTDNTLGITTHYAYSRVGDVYRTTVTKTAENGISDGSCSFIEQDVLAREVRRGSKNLEGVWTYVNTEYDAFGRKYRTSEPYFEGADPSQWTVYEYDDYSRPVRVTSFTGKVVHTTYDGLTVTVQDTVMTKTKTIDANRQVVTTIDEPGGTVNYKYDADYNLLESDYDGLKTRMKYDNWGRKILLDDLSSSTHNTYSYDAYGELLTEVTPKGTTTYTYDGLSGRIATKLVAGLTPADGTNILSTYSYNPDTKLLDQITVVNPNDGDSLLKYSYDPQRRLNRTDETQSLLPSGTAVFTKKLTFDAFSRVDVETSTASAFGKNSTKTIKHNYSDKNGVENQLMDNESLSNLWSAKKVDARGNLLEARLGNGITISNRYDEFGYATQFQHQLGSTNVMTLNTSFDSVLGNLNSRYNSMFDTTENFTYDHLDRLTAWDANSETLLTLPFNYPSKDGFIFTNTSGNNTNVGSVTNDAGTLKVFLKNGVASRTLPEIDANSCHKLRIKAIISNKTDMIGTPVIV